MLTTERNSGRIVAASPAKINLFLQVAGKRGDGFHELVNVMQRVDLCDVVTVENSPGSGLTLDADIAGLPQEKNIAFLAAQAFFERTGGSPDVRIRIEKKIPIGGGLGGGSSNAACVLQSLNRLQGHPLRPEEIYGLALRLGADVPFFLRKGTWAMTGRGDRFRMRMPAKPLHYLLFNFGFQKETRVVYAAFRMKEELRPSSFSLLRRGLASGCASRVRRAARNDLLDAYLSAYPSQRDIYMDLKNKMCQNLFLSGSGSTLFSIFDSRHALLKSFLRLETALRKHVLQAGTF